MREAAALRVRRGTAAAIELLHPGLRRRHARGAPAARHFRRTARASGYRGTGSGPGPGTGPGTGMGTGMRTGKGKGPGLGMEPHRERDRAGNGPGPGPQDQSPVRAWAPIPIPDPAAQTRRAGPRAGSWGSPLKPRGKHRGRNDPKSSEIIRNNPKSPSHGASRDGGGTARAATAEGKQRVGKIRIAVSGSSVRTAGGS